MSINLDEPPPGSCDRASSLVNHHFSPMADIIHVPGVETVRSPQLSVTTPLAPVVTKGKFFFVDREKFFIKGVTYGPFAPASHGAHGHS